MYVYLKRCRQWSHQVGCIRVGPLAPSPYTYFACVINFVDYPYSNDRTLMHANSGPDYSLFIIIIIII